MIRDEQPERINPKKSFGFLIPKKHWQGYLALQTPQPECLKHTQSIHYACTGRCISSNKTMYACYLSDDIEATMMTLER